MSLHELDLAGRISDKIACVRGDRVDRFGTPEEIFTEGYIPKLYQMTTGSYDELTGDLELPAVQGEPKVFVLTGNGTGTGVFRGVCKEKVSLLQREFCGKMILTILRQKHWQPKWCQRKHLQHSQRYIWNVQSS